MRRWGAVAVLGALVVACGSTGGPTDAGIDAAWPPGDLPVLHRATAERPDIGPPVLDTLGVGTAPEGGDPVTFWHSFFSFGLDHVEPGMIYVYRDDVPRALGDCPADVCSGVHTEDMARATIEMRAHQWYAARFVPDDARVVPGIAVHARAPASAGGDVQAPTLDGATWPALETAFDFTRAPGTAAAGMRVIDDEGVPIAGAAVRVIVDGEWVLEGPPGSDGLRIGYFDVWMGFDGDATSTSGSGLFGIANIPVPGESATLRVEAWGVMAEGEAARMIACDEIRVERDAFASILALGPLRADRPDACR